MNNISVLTDLQRDVLNYLFGDSWFRRYFYLTGGTALSAFYLFHRYSDDLDFFGHDVEMTPAANLIHEMAKKLMIKTRRIQTAPGFQRYHVGGRLQIDIVSDVGWRSDTPELIENFMIDSLKNIAINKVTAILSRLDAKDYIDLFFLITEKKLDIVDLLTLAKNKDAGMDIFTWASVIADAQKLSILPRMIRPVSLKEIQAFYLKLRDELLDHINPNG